MKRKLILCLSIVFALLISICCFSGCGDKTYTVKFLNYDGTVISTQTVVEGKLPKEPTETPVRANDGEYRYEFSGWDKEVKKATKNVSYTAEFEPHRIYLVVFKNHDEIPIYQYYADEGDIAEYVGATPTRADEQVGAVKKVYTFTGWNEELGEVNSSKVYTAQFECVNHYLVVFKNFDDTILYQYYAVEGSTAEYVGATPTRTADESKDYTFKGWNVELGTVNSVIEYTAEYSWVYKDAVLDDGDMIIGDRDWQGGNV